MVAKNRYSLDIDITNVSLFEILWKSTNLIIFGPIFCNYILFYGEVVLFYLIYEIVGGIVMKLNIVHFMLEHS